MAHPDGAPTPKGHVSLAKTEKPKTKRQLTAEAQEAALGGNWELALTLNDQMLERFPRDAEALNRKGRALIELRQLTAARDAYSEALKSDPANMIARRNLQRLEMLYNRADGSLEGQETAVSTIPNSAVFIEEVGRTWVDELANPAELGVLAEVSPGAKLELAVKDGRLVVLSEDGRHLGEVEARTGSRVIDLIEGGNRFEAFALGVSGQSLRYILRETFRDPAQADKIAFPRQVRATQDLMRERELLFQRDESDFLFGDDDELLEEADAETIEEDDSDDDHGDESTDASIYIDESLTEREEDAM
jgi:tetratricopeptide (TPR) repeat protein